MALRRFGEHYLLVPRGCEYRKEASEKVQAEAPGPRHVARHTYVTYQPVECVFLPLTPRFSLRKLTENDRTRSGAWQVQKLE